MYRLSNIQITYVSSALVFPVTIPNAARLSHSSRCLSMHLSSCMVASPTPRYLDSVQLTPANFCQLGICDKNNIMANHFGKALVK